jgi:hypothetical protein
MKATITQIRQAIADTGATITGIVKTFPRSPVKIDTAEVPCLIALSGNSIFPDAPVDGGLVTEQAEYTAQVVVAPIGQGNIETTEAQAEALLEVVIEKYMKTPTLGTTFVRSFVAGRSPVIELAGFDNLWIGFEVRLQVTQSYIRTS